MAHFAPESVIADGLAVAGQSGTLALRFLNTPVAGRLRGKTGTLNQVTALAGYVETLAGADVSFSFIVNLPPDQTVDADDLRVQDALATALLDYPQGPSLEELGPQPVVVSDDGGGEGDG